MTPTEREAKKRRQAALAVCASVQRSDAALVLDMLGLLDLRPPRRTGTPWFDTGFDGGRRAVLGKEA